MIRTHLLRLRLETDRLVRSRALVNRALGGHLERGAYGGLLSSLAQLLPEELGASAHADLESLSPGSPASLGAPVALGLFERALGRSQARQRAARLASLVVVGTSWTGEAAERLEGHYSGATQLLEQLSWRGAGELERLASRGEEVLALAELARGAFLGALSELEVAWPPPRFCHRLWAEFAAPAANALLPNTTQGVLS